MNNLKNTIIVAFILTGVLFFFLLRYFDFEKVCAIAALISAVVYGILQTLPKSNGQIKKKKKKHPIPEAIAQKAVRREIVEINGKRYIEYLDTK